MRHSLATIVDTKCKKFHGGFFELEMLEIFERAFFIKNHYWNWKLYTVVLSIDLVFSSKMEKESPKINTRKALKREKHEKRKV